jgi:hypothetical protein
MRNSSWQRWFNSFGFITAVIFSFAFLTTMDFSPGEGRGRFPVPHVMVKAEGGQTLERFRRLAAARYGEAGASFYIIQDSKSQTYAYKTW